MKRIQLSLLAMVAGIMSCYSQPTAFNRGDHLFPSGGGSMVTVTTGIPYVGIAEYAYGFSDGFSLGIVAGITPKVGAYGFRVRAILARPSENSRIYFRMPAFYYPRTQDLGGDPWVLAWPVVSIEWKLDSGTRISAGGGVVVASCFDSFVKTLGLSSKEMEEDEGFMGGAWNTLHAGVAFPVSETIMFQSEATVVMSGIKVAGKDWVGGPPVIVVVGFSYSL